MMALSIFWYYNFVFSLYLSCLGPLATCSRRFLYYLTIQSFDRVYTWWLLIQKRAVYTKLDIYDFIDYDLARYGLPVYYKSY